MTSQAEEAHGIPSAGSAPAPQAEEHGIPSAELPSAPPPRGLVPCLVYAALCGSVVAGLGNPIVVPVNRTLHVSLEAAQWTLTMSPVSYTHLRAHETVLDLVCRLLLEKKKNRALPVYLLLTYTNHSQLLDTHMSTST